MVGMSLKKLFDALAILLKLLFQNDQAFNQAQNQEAFGTLDRLRYMPLMGCGKSCDAFLVSVLAIKSVAMEKRIPFPHPGLAQVGWSGKALKEFPCSGNCPIIEGFQSRGIVFH